MSEINGKDVIPSDNLDSNQDKPNELHLLFSVDPDKEKCYNLPHDLDAEQIAIFEDKLLVKLAPPFNNITLENIFPGDIYDWKLHLHNPDVTIAIKEHKAEVSNRNHNETLLAQLKKTAKLLHNEYMEISNSLINRKSRRIYACAAAQNAITASRAEDRRSSQENNRQAIESQGQREPYHKGETIDIEANEIKDSSSKPLSHYIPSPCSCKRDFMPKLSSHDADIHYKHSVIATGMNYDITSMQNYQIRKLYELEIVNNDIKILEDSIKTGDDTYEYKFKVGQIVPDNSDELLKCYYCSGVEKCEGCNSKDDCSILTSHQIFDAFTHYNNKIDLSETARCAMKDFGIDFDNPMKMVDELNFTPFPPIKDVDNTLVFKNDKDKTFMLVESNISNESIIALPGVCIDINDVSYMPSLPLPSARLLNMPDIHKKPKHEVFFTDCLEFAWYAEPTEDKKIITSYYGGQFGDIKINCFPLRNRTVHYLIFEYPGISIDEAIKKACHNYRQMKKESNINVDFYFLKPNMDDSTLTGFDLKKKMTAEEFCDQYMEDEKAKSNKSDSPTSLEDSTNKDTEESEMLLGPLIGRGKFILMAGTKHSGKTTLAISIAASVASGREIVQILRPKKQEGVLLFNMEFPQQEYIDHAKPIVKTVSKALITETASKKGVPFAKMPLKFEHMAGEGIKLHSKDGIDVIKEKVSPYKDKIKLLIIDNMTAASDGGSQENRGWKDYTYPYICELNKMGITVLIITHWDNNDIVGGKDKLRNARDCIVVKKTKPKDKTDVIYASVNKEYDTSSYPFHKLVMNLTLDKYAKSPKWEFDDKYLKHILLSDCPSDDLGSYFNTTGKTIRDWWKKQFSGTHRKDRFDLRKYDPESNMFVKK